jgi:hypothetical protein
VKDPSHGSLAFFQAFFHAWYASDPVVYLYKEKLTSNEVHVALRLPSEQYDLRRQFGFPCFSRQAKSHHHMKSAFQGL